MPGVTVEAASPVLIEKVRIFVSDGEAVPHRRPAAGHVYLTFSLTGFKTLRREG